MALGHNAVCTCNDCVQERGSRQAGGGAGFAVVVNDAPPVLGPPFAASPTPAVDIRECVALGVPSDAFRAVVLGAVRIDRLGVVGVLVERPSTEPAAAFVLWYDREKRDIVHAPVDGWRGRHLPG